MNERDDGLRDAESGLAETDVAIVGMSGRFPGAADVDELWARVAGGEDCLVDVADSHLVAAGVDPSTCEDDHYVRRDGVVDGVDLFDPAFFGIGDRDAALMDPQHRLLLECAWESIETAGYVPERFDGSIGVFAGCGVNTYLLHNILTNPELVEDLGWFLVRHTGNDKDFLATGISYRLGLEGPSISVQTACSTSLVAVHLGVQSLLAFECDMALAGGVTIDVPHGTGYRYRDGEILSPEGRCRAFDQHSDGTVLTGGAGVVALRRAADALRDGDPVLALIRASAVNNDGARKVGYLAPSVDGHADVVREALELGQIDARTITLLEAHGTGTAVGDPIEVAALTEAFGSYTDERQFCRLVSTKPNIGHLDTAAGVASLVKVVQALRHRKLPPLANHTAPSPLLDLDRTPFVVSAELTDWVSDGPRRAGVSSLGVGGTNAHVIVEEAPATPSREDHPGAQVLCISGHTPGSVDMTSERLASYLEGHEDVELADVAFTLTTGRRLQSHRRVIAATDRADAVLQLRSRRSSGSSRAVVTSDEAPAVVFLLPGGGAQYPGMASGLDARFEEFHRTISAGVELVGDLTGLDLRTALGADAAPERIRQADVSLPAVFLTDLAMARQWMEWGVAPGAIVGHSLGEYAAAHLAGVLSFEDAIRVVTERARLMMRVGSEGTAMLSVSMNAEDLRALLPEDVSVAVINTPRDCVVSGRTPSIECLSEELSQLDVDHVLLPLALAAHSSLLDPILDEFLDFMQTIPLGEPRRPYVSNLTGTWVRPEEATSATYWVDHLRNPVRFSDNLKTVLDGGPVVTVELGPGHALSSFARRMPTPPLAAIPALRHPGDPVDDTSFAIGAFARLWANGVDVEPANCIGHRARRTTIPPTAFDRVRCWIEPGSPAPGTAVGGRRAVDARPTPALDRIDDVADWGWVVDLDAAGPPPVPTGAVGPWLVVGDDERASDVAAELRARGEHTVTAPTVLGAPLDEVRALCLVGARPPRGAGPAASFEATFRHLLVGGSEALRALAASAEGGRLVVLTQGAVTSDGPSSCPAHALALGPVLVGAKEYPHVETVLVDAAEGADVSAVVDEVVGGDEPIVVVGQDGARYRRGFRTRRLEASDERPFREGGTYVVTGGLGRIGGVIARHLASTYGASVAVVTSSPLPGTRERAEFLACHGSGDPTARRLRRLEQLEACGSRVVTVTADLSDPVAVRAALDEVETALGPIDGVVHAAGRLRDRLVEQATHEDYEAVVGAKAKAAVVLTEELARRGIGDLILISSTSTALAPAGQCAYVSANAVLDALSGRCDGLRIRTIGFGVWAGEGMAVDAARRARLGTGDGERVEHPVFHEWLAEPDGVHRFIGELDARTDWVVGDHRIDGRVAVLPGTGHLDLMLSALAAIDVTPAVERVTLLDPVAVPDGDAITIRVTIDAPDGAGTRHVRIESDAGREQGWTLHSEAVHTEDSPAVPSITIAPPEGLELDPLERPRRHIRFGTHWPSVDAFALHRDEVRARVEPDDRLVADGARWRLHPGIADVATACAAALDQRPDDVLFVPVSYRRAVSFRPLSGASTIVARRDPLSTQDVLVADVYVVDDLGEVSAVLEGLELRSTTNFPDLLASTVEPDPGVSIPPLLAAVDLGITPEEGVEALERVLSSGSDHTLVSSLDLDALARADDHDDEQIVEAGLPAPSEAELPELVRRAFEDLLGVSPVPLDGDFFELGGHSLIAIRLLARLHKSTGVRLPLSELLEAPTPHELAHRLAEDPSLVVGGEEAEADGERSPGARDPELHPSLVPVRTGGELTPLFVVHGAGGNVLNLWGLARHLPPGRPIYGIQATGIDGRSPPDPTIEAMAARYVEAVRSLQPRGPYLLGGYSGGGVVALEMVRQLRSFDEQVAKVIMIDTVPRNSERPTAMRRYRNVLRTALSNGPRAVVPWLRYTIETRFDLVPQDIESLGLGYGDSVDHGVVNLADHFEAAVESYEFGTYDVDVVVAKAQAVYPAWPRHYGWKGRVLGRIDTFVSPGNHFEMLTKENAPVLAARLAPYLATSDRP